MTKIIRLPDLETIERLSRQPVSVNESETARVASLLRLVGQNPNKYRFSLRGSVFTFESIPIAA